MPSRIVQKIVSVHPPEAEAISRAFGQARAASETALARMNAIHAGLNQEWEGRQQTVFERELESSIDRLSKILLPQLRFWETKYRDFLAEEEIETVECF